jgi:hypothetical protein
VCAIYRFVVECQCCQKQKQFQKKIKKANLLGGALGAVGPNAQQAAEAGAKIGGFFKSFF